MKRTFQLSILLAVLSLVLVKCNVIWRSPKTYQPSGNERLDPPVMSLEEYSSSGLINRHSRPYFYTIESQKTGGAVLVFGAEHINDPSHGQFQVLEKNWKDFNPTVALIEGRLGFLFSWAQHPIKKFGESGLTAKLAKKKGISLYSWEPQRKDEIGNLLQNYDAMHVGAFFSLRPYLNKNAALTKAEQDKMMDGLIKERTDEQGLREGLRSVEQLDSLWKADLPGEPNWRIYKHPENGWPEGKLKQMAISTNGLRNEWMCRSIIELVNKGERVFITMGSSHAPRIEKTLKQMIK